MGSLGAVGVDRGPELHCPTGKPEGSDGLLAIGIFGDTRTFGRIGPWRRSGLGRNFNRTFGADLDRLESEPYRGSGPTPLRPNCLRTFGRHLFGRRARRSAGSQRDGSLCRSLCSISHGAAFYTCDLTPGSHNRHPSTGRVKQEGNARGQGRAPRGIKGRSLSFWRGRGPRPY